MSTATEERVQHALSQLLERLLPTYPNDDDAAADERFDSAFNFALDNLESAGEPSVAADVNHVSDLIKRKLIRDNSTPEKALKFTNLYSRLLTQPVLNQKWAMLYFLHQLSDSEQDTAAGLSGSVDGNGEQVDGFPPGIDPSQQFAALSPRREAEQMMERGPNVSRESPRQTNGRGGPRHPEVDDPVFHEAFANGGLTNLPESGTLGHRLPVRSERRDKVGRPRRVDDSSDNAAAETEDPGVGQSLATMEPSEPALLRELPFTLQGLSSKNLSFAENKTLKLPVTLPIPLISLLHTLAEPSLLYKDLSEFVESSEGDLVGQSFRSALGAELRSYLGLVATLEGQIRRALAMLDASQPRQGIGKAGVTLRRCVIWTREATMGLRLMSLMVEESKGKKGGRLISSIHSFSLSHGDPFVGAFAERLLSHVTRPLYDMLRQWIYDGELSDPFLEFFVSEQHEDVVGDGAKGGATSVWEDKYKLNSAMIPTIVSEEFARKVFLIGKTLNFIRHGCGDAAWVESYSKEASRELRYGDTATLERSIGEAYKTTMARLIHLMADKFMLFEHLQALKKYLLLGAGDFIAILMESLAGNLDRPANTQYRHTLTAQLEHAVRNSNAQYDSPEVLRRLDSRMLELSHGEIGWDVFTLEYKIDAPVDVIVTPFGSKQYLKVFNFLWRVKRVEFALGSTWRRCMTGARGVLGSVEDKVGADWKRARCAIAEMIHFVNQLQHYILFEVIESSWSELQRAMRQPDRTLDDLIQAHARYLTNITRKGLLGSATSDFTGQLHELLKIMLAYRDAVDGLYSFSVAEFTRRQEATARIETRTAAGRWGITERDNDNDDDASTPSAAAATAGRKKPHAANSPFPLPGLLSTSATGGGTSEDDLLPAIRTRLATLSSDFRARVNILLGDLYHQPDADMRWLAMVMNFNDVYQPVRRKRKVAASSAAGGERRREKETPAPAPAAAGARVGTAKEGREKGKGKAVERK